MIKSTFKVEIYNLKVSKQGYYSFDYYLTVDGKRYDDSLGGSYSGRSREAFRKVLKRGWAAQLVLQKEF